MTVQAYRPAPEALRPHVRSLWYVRGAPERRYERILPQPVAHLIVNLSEPYRLLSRGGEEVGEPFAGAFVSGLQREYLVIENPDELWQCGAEIAPAGLAGLLSVPPVALAGRVRDADGIIAGSAAWRERLQAAGEGDVDGDATLDVLESLLLDALGSADQPDPVAVAALARLDEDPDLPIAALADAIGIGGTRLVERFRAAVGIPPKPYADLVRFARFLAAIPFDVPEPRWSELVAGTGYYDQPHFIRSFKRYTGYTPTQYLEGIRRFGADWPSFVPMDEPA